MGGNHLLVRRPAPTLADGELTHLERTPVDADLALQQWQAYVAAFGARGWIVHEVAPADQHPDGVFVEDTVVAFDDLAVLTSPGAAAAEVRWPRSRPPWRRCRRRSPSRWPGSTNRVTWTEATS
ncbi:MAG TPA: hypothetical protein VFU98_10160 [Microlunatus sp.]|nr:hypothetical protein [Microlunatus sp.]